jgi:hypothetical protein
MRQSEPALHGPEEPLEIVAPDQKVVVTVATATVPNIRTAKARPATAAVGAAKAAR